MNYKCVTVWHKKPDGDYVRLLFEHAFIDRIKKAEISAGEYVRCDQISARLFTVCECDIDVGDRLLEGYSRDLIPPENSYVIASVKENMRVCAHLRHYKVQCV